MKKVDNFIGKYFPGGCFMKLSTRSPKDAGWRYQKGESLNLLIDELTGLLKGTTCLDYKARNKIYKYFL